MNKTPYTPLPDEMPQDRWSQQSGPGRASSDALQRQAMHRARRTSRAIFWFGFAAGGMAASVALPLAFAVGHWVGGR